MNLVAKSLVAMVTRTNDDGDDDGDDDDDDDDDDK